MSSIKGARFVSLFFSGEEEALLGSRAYVLAHQSELDQLRAVLIMNSGAQAPRGFHFQVDRSQGHYGETSFITRSPGRKWIFT